MQLVTEIVQQEKKTSWSKSEIPVYTRLSKLTWWENIPEDLREDKKTHLPRFHEKTWWLYNWWVPR